MKTKFLLLITLVTTSLFISCSSDDDSGPVPIGYTVTLQYPENFGSSLVEGATVTVVNLTTNEETFATTNATGAATFELTPGNYSVSASIELMEEDVEALTGIYESLFLNATEAQVSILDSGNLNLQLEGSSIGDWVIKEFYYAGVPSYYFYDGFIEIYNNSTGTLYADGLLFGNTEFTSSNSTSGFIASGENDVYLSIMMQIPGGGTDYPVEPGESIVIAIDGIDHKDDENGNPNSPVNLGPSIADFEVYFDVNPTTPDTDNPDVDNVNILYAATTTMFDYIPGVHGSGLVIFRNDAPDELERFTEPNTTSSREYVRVPNGDIIDGLDAVGNETVTAEYKRLPTSIDAGMNTVGDSYNGTSLRRLVKQEVEGRKVLLDTNNSTDDFEANPTPNPKGW
nr:DUF4876 domain-containing protein [uncultured Allomuricauda sp.]